MIKKIMVTCFALTLANLALALPNPASVYCGAHGGKTVLVQGKGLCVFTDQAGKQSYCEEWAYFRGQCKPGVNYFPVK